MSSTAIAPLATTLNYTRTSEYDPSLPVSVAVLEVPVAPLTTEVGRKIPLRLCARRKEPKLKTGGTGGENPIAERDRVCLVGRELNKGRIGQ